MKIKATINDVAKLAGVSITTVSRVVNGNYPVKQSTKEKVLQIIKELEYTPNDIAVSMIKKKTNTIGVIVPSITNIFFSTLIKGINDYLYEKGYTMLLLQSQENEKELVEKLLSRQVDGIVIADSNIEKNKNFYKKVSETNHLIFINCYDDDLNTVSCNQKKGTNLALQYLKELGHKNILLVRGSENSYSYKLKEDIYLKTVDEPKILTIKNGNTDDAITNTKIAIQKYFSSANNITSIFACNDLMAIGAMEGLKEINIKVPDDVSIIGFDNIFMCDLVTPKLTTIDQDIYNLGKKSSENILNMIEKNDKVKVEIESKLKIRGSCV